MPGTVSKGSPIPLIAAGQAPASLAVFAGYIRREGRSQAQIDATCALLARAADSIVRQRSFMDRMLAESLAREGRVTILLDNVRARG